MTISTKISMRYISPTWIKLHVDMRNAWLLRVGKVVELLKLRIQFCLSPDIVGGSL